MKMKRFLAIILAAVIASLIFTMGAVASEEPITDEKAFQMAKDELELSRKMIYYPHAFEGDFLGFYNAYENLARKFQNPGIKAENYELVELLTDKREALTQIVDDPSSTVWFIWGDKMATEEIPDEAWEIAYDNPGFRPSLCPYMIEDQANVKGNVVIIAGGGTTHKANEIEGYPIAEYFNKEGYNAFVLQRRISPYSKLDMALDLGRAIRYIRYYAEEKGIGNADTIIGCGFSAGALCVMNTIATQYGHVTPDKYYPDYVCDEIDQENADMTVALPIYSPQKNDLDYSVNPNIPPIFTAVGQNDAYFGAAAGENLEWLLSLGSDICFFFAPDAIHGGGLQEGIKDVCDAYTVLGDWKVLCNDFLDTRLGYKEKVIKFIGE